MADPKLILNITNHVAMNFTANVLLSAGESPLMSLCVDEMEDLVSRCDGLVVNIGTLDAQFMQAARKACEAANARGLKWVLDPAGVGASAFRTSCCTELVRRFRPSVIRANASEVVALLSALREESACEEGRGVDSTLSSDAAVQAAKDLSARSGGAIVSMSGEKDYITDSRTVLEVCGGSPLMPQVTAMGCAASALTAAFIASADNTLEQARGAMALMSEAGERAALRSESPGTFQAEFLDALASLSGTVRQSPRFRAGQLRLYLVTDRHLAGQRDLADIVQSAVRGGVTMVQLREKDLSAREFIAEGRRLKEILRPAGVPLIINDRVDVALACGADGVHIGQSDMPCSEARRLLGPRAIIGLSVENMRQVAEANLLDVDYIGVSPVFSTPTKTDTAPPFGLEGLREACALSVHPAVAIGGVNASNASQLRRAGADGVAVVSAIVSSPDPCRAAGELKNLLK